MFMVGMCGVGDLKPVVSVANPTWLMLSELVPDGW